jgi:hypothetical protein
VRYRVQDVSSGSEEEASPRTAAFLYCAECGRVVSATLLEPDLGDSDPEEVVGEKPSTAEHEAEGTGEPDTASETG